MSKKDSCGNRIREALRARNMVQADLCRITGIPKSAMSQYCNGGLVPRQDRTFLIARALDVDEAWLMGFDVPMEKRERPATEIDDGLAELMDLFKNLSADNRSKLLELGRLFLNAQHNSKGT